MCMFGVTSSKKLGSVGKSDFFLKKKLIVLSLFCSIQRVYGAKSSQS